MATTATKKQSEAIRKRMHEIRCELPYHMDEARSEIRDQLNWRTQVRKHPLIAAGAGAVIAYMLVPQKRLPRPTAKKNRLHQLFGGQSNEEVEETVQKSTLVSGILGSLMTLALRNVMTMATQHFTGHLTNSFQQSFARRDRPVSASTTTSASASKRETYR